MCMIEVYKKSKTKTKVKSGFKILSIATDILIITIHFAFNGFLLVIMQLIRKWKQNNGCYQTNFNRLEQNYLVL